MVLLLLGFTYSQCFNQCYASLQNKDTRSEYGTQCRGKCDIGDLPFRRNQAAVIHLGGHDNRSLIVTGSPGDVETAEAIVGNLRPASRNRWMNLATSMLTLANHKVDRIYRNIESLVNERMNEVPFKGSPAPG